MAVYDWDFSKLLSLCLILNTSLSFSMYILGLIIYYQAKKHQGEEIFKKIMVAAGACTVY